MQQINLELSDQVYDQAVTVVNVFHTSLDWENRLADERK